MTSPLHTIHHEGSLLAVAPSHALSWQRVQLPAGSLPRGWMHERGNTRLRNILEGLLEDLVLDEPAQLHFALPSTASTGQSIWVAVCNRAWLKDALQTLQAAGVSPHRVVPEWAPDSPAPGTVWVTGATEAAQLVWTDAQGLHHLPLDTQHNLPEQVPSEVRDVSLLLAEPGVAPLAERLFGRSAQIQTHAERLQTCARSDWNLAQMDLARRNPRWVQWSEAVRALWQAPQWRPARWALAGMLAVQLIGLNAYAWHAQRVLAGQRETVRSILTSTFPQETVVLDAPVQMARAVARLQQASGTLTARDLETQLGALGPAIAQTGATPSGLHYSDGQTRLEWATPLQPEALMALEAQAHMHNLSVNAQDNGVRIQAASAATP